MISKILKVFQVLALCSLFCLVQGKQATVLKPNELSPTHRDVKYGAHPKELINFWQFNSNEPLESYSKFTEGDGWVAKKMRYLGLISSS
jgi:hypothetical protein